MRLHVPVEIRNRYDGAWTEGFQVTEETEWGYRVRRLCDDIVLPELFKPDEVRER
jgi:hypothetical protein